VANGQGLQRVYRGAVTMKAAKANNVHALHSGRAPRFQVQLPRPAATGAPGRAMRQVTHFLTLLMLGAGFCLVSCRSSPQSRLENSWTGFYYVATIRDGQIFLVMAPNPGNDYHGLFKREIGPFRKGRWDTEYLCGTNPVHNGVYHGGEEGVHSLRQSKQDWILWYGWSKVMMKGIPVEGRALLGYEGKP
jgi:hypothetical protein